MVGVARFTVPKDDRIAWLFQRANDELDSYTLGARQLQMRRIRDQLFVGPEALSERYHPDIPGLSKKQQERVRRARTQVNFVRPSLDRFVFTIHAGRITRSATDEMTSELIQSDEHADAMECLCENAFAYGTGVLVPILRGDIEYPEVSYWLPDPMRTMLIVDETDVRRTLGVVELLYKAGAGYTVAGARFVTERFEGFYIEDGANKTLEVTEHRLGCLPAVVAYGRPLLHMGCKYGESLIPGAVETSIKVTDNNTNLELLRDRQTQAILIIKGEPSESSKDRKDSVEKFLASDDKDFDAKYIQPQVQIDQVLKLSDRHATDGAISDGMPLDVTRPELITGTDASATAARQRAHPLIQRSAKMVRAWRTVENRTTAVIHLMVRALRGESLPEKVSIPRVIREAGIGTLIIPSVAESESETLANWIQKAGAYFVRVEDAIEYYSPHLAAAEKAKLADRWRAKFEAQKAAPAPMRENPPVDGA